MSHDIAAAPTAPCPVPPPHDGHWSEEALGNAIGALKEQAPPEALRAFLSERIDEMTRAGGPAPLLARLHNELGLFHLHREEMEGARTHLDRAVALNPGNLGAAYNRANLSFYLKEFGEALERYERLLATAPDHAGAAYNAALCHALTGRVTEALPLFQRVTALDPDYAGAHFWAGECHLHQGSPQDALPCFRRAVALNPDHPESSRGLAICLFHGGHHDEAIGLCDHMLLTFGPELTALRVKGDALLALNRPLEAAQSHVDMALIDFDAREFLIARAGHLRETEPGKAPGYIACLLEHFPDFKGALDPDGSATDSTAPRHATL